MGGDSAATEETRSGTRVQSKVFKTGPFLIGYAGSFRIGQIIEHCGSFDDMLENIEDLFGFMVNVFVTKLIRELKRNHAVKIESGLYTMDSSILVAVRGRIFEILEDFQVAENELGISAIGLGSDAALGVLVSIQKSTYMTAYDAVLLSLQTSETISNCVMGPFTIVEA